MRYQCDNCNKAHAPEDCKTLAECSRVFERLDPGSEVPAGECPDCGAFVYVARPGRPLPLKPPYWCCPECGCTDVQSEGWIHCNTNTFTGDDSGTDAWCPQCDTHFRGLEQSDTLKPYVPE